MLIGVLTSKDHFSSVFYNRMFDEIRQSRDALRPDSKSANMVERDLFICNVSVYSQNGEIVLPSFYGQSVPFGAFIISC